MIVMKFGGTSVDGAARMSGVARIVVGRAAERPVVVTSAMAGVTNALVDLLETAVRGDRNGLEAKVGALADRHDAVAAELAPGDAALRERLDAQLRELRVLLRGVRLLGAATPRSADAILGFGEMVAALVREGADAAAVDSREVVVTDDRFGTARPDVALTAERCRDRVVPLAAAGSVPVLGGYLGATPEGVPTTLGRGGSDLSVAVLGLALAVRRVEIWTDVDGMLTADPRLVPGARLIERLTFREAAELAGLGAKVLHPAAIDPAIQGGLEVVIRNSLVPGAAGTVIGPSGTGTEPVRSVAARGALELVTLRAPGRLRSAGFMPEVLGRIDARGLLPLMSSAGFLGLEFLLPCGEELDAVAADLADLGQVIREPELGMVACVGEGLAARPDLWARVLDAACTFGVRRVAQGPRASSLALVVPERDLAPLVRRLHEGFVAPGPGGDA